MQPSRSRTARDFSAPWRVPLFDLDVDAQLLAAVHDALASGWWSMGPRVEQLESRFASRLGSPHAVAVSSGSAALHLALLAVGCRPGDEVVMPSLTFVAAANAVVRVGATPVFCDVGGLGDPNLDPADLDAAIGPRCRAVVVLHYGGFPCAMDDVMAIARRHGVAVIEDAAHAPGATDAGGRSCGTIGDVGCFSFFANKNIPIGEGGMIVTAEPALAATMRSLRAHGLTIATWQRARGYPGTYDVVDAGFNYRLDDLRAAIAGVQLDRLDRSNEARRRLAIVYHDLLDGVHGLRMPLVGERHSTSAHHLAWVVLPGGVRRDDVRAALASEGIQTSVHYPPIHRFSFYAGRVCRPRPLPRTEALADRLLSLPLFPHLPVEDVEFVAAALVRACASSADGC